MSMIKSKNSKLFGNGMAVKVLSVAAFVGLAFALPVCAEEDTTPIVLGDEVSTELLKNKPVDVPTLDYLKENNVLIPQKGKWDATNKTWAEADPIKSVNGSAYTVEKIGTLSGDKSNIEFTYTTSDEEGNLTDTYYKINYEVPTPKDYKTPDGYVETFERINNTLTKEAVTNVVFKDIKYTGSYGGAIYNIQNKSDVDILADFINNSVTSSYTYGGGGAIYNSSGTIGDIFGDFIKNSVKCSESAYGGAIYNTGTIGNIFGDFINNSATATGSGSRAYGGAIYNYNTGTIDNIVGDFINNFVTVKGTKYSAYGGAISNYYGTIGNITGDFINNSATGSSSRAEGGAIYNYSKGTIGNIVGDFINNSAKGSKYAYGGAISNDGGTIGNITGDFINNSVTSTGYYNSANGGAIDNNGGTIGNIVGDFINNSVTGSSSAFGGAIYNTGTIGNIFGDFIKNSVKCSESAYGGAISNEDGIIGDIVGDFVNNSVTSTSSYANGGAISNEDGIIGDIVGDFVNNSATSSYFAYGGAIYNTGTIGDIVGDFINNSVTSTGSYSSSAYGGAIYNSSGTIGDIVGDFINNSVTSTGSSSSYAYGGAIYNNGGTIGDIVGDFINNSATTTDDFAKGGAIYNDGGTIANIFGDFINNSVKGSYSSAYGGAIYNSGTIGAKDDDGNIIGGIINSNFIGNHAISENDTAQGGAIYQGGSTPLNLISQDGFTSVIKDNYTESKGVRDDNAIYLYNSTINFQMKNGGKFYVADNIDGDATKNNTVNITGDSIDNTMFYMLNDIRNSAVNVGSTTLNTINNDIHTYNFKSFTLTDNVNMVADINLETQEMDRFTAESYGNHGDNKLSVIGMNIVKDAPSGSEPLAIYFAESGLKNNVSNGDINLPTGKWQTKAYTPIYQYTVTYDTEYANEENGLQDGGYFVFTQGGKLSGNPSDNYNPAVLSAPVSGVAASQATVNETFKYVFEHSDAFTQMPSFERQALINADKYTLSTDFNHNLGSLCPEHNNKAGWFRPYVTLESMNLKHGPKVDAITYGSLVGFDSDFQHLKHGWTGITTGYVGYNGNQLSYSGVDTTMNGGLLGLTQTMYKGNFWSALTLSAGASVGENTTMYGKEDFTSLLAGVGSKTGYNFEFKEGRFIIQPIMFMSYTFVNTFDYTNAAGVKIKPSPAHSIQLNPSVRFITNTKNGWQPYASVGMVWNVFNQNKVMANAVRLPEMSIKPYVEYGLGIQKNWKDNFTAFGQAMVRNGGRNGIAFTAGFRWTIGAKPTEKVNAPKPERKVIKQITPKQKMAMD